MIGGTDIVVEMRAGAPAARVILQTVRRYWPHCVYKDAADETVPVEMPDEAWPPQLRGRQFFLYRDEDAARSWDQHGAIPENDNLMLHVILPDAAAAYSVPSRLTLVCGEPVGQIGAMIDEIRKELKP